MNVNLNVNANNANANANAQTTATASMSVMLHAEEQNVKRCFGWMYPVVKRNNPKLRDPLNNPDSDSDMS